MCARLIKLGVVLISLGALAFGGVSLATAGGKPKVKPSIAKAHKNSAAKPKPSRPTAAGASQGKRDGTPDGDNVQEGDQTTPDTGNTADEQPGEAPASAESSSESGPSDGPGGHADESGSVDHQFQGEE